jgi:hypothetical protein
MKYKGLAVKIREAMRVLGAGGRKVTNPELAIKLDMVFDKEKQVLYRALRDFIKSGEVEKISRGVYKYTGKTSEPQLRQIMWRALRARRTVTVDDIVELSGASREYTKNWLRMLVSREIVRRTRAGNDWKYQLINDPVIMPKDELKAKKAATIRAEKKKALDAINRIIAIAVED